MSKYLCRRISVLLLSAIFLIPVFIKPAPAMDYLIGVKGGYFAWDPFMKRIGNQQFSQIDKGQGALYGPIFSMLFTPDLSLSVSGLFGTETVSWCTVDYYDGSANPRTTGFSMNMDRIDIDSALSYRLTENFKIFAGYKYQHNVMTMESVGYERSGTGQQARYEKVTITMPYNGPAAGIGFTSPLGDRYFFAANLSALYMWGKFDFKDKYIEYDENGITTGPQENNSNNITLQTRGLNFEPTVGASMGDGMPIFTLGFRMQWTQTKMIDAEALSVDKKWANDYQYGVFVAIVQPF